MRYFFTLIIFFTLGHLAYSQLPSITGVANGNTSGCAPLTITFNVNDVSGNEPGTTYSFDFGDSTPPLTFNQSNVPPTVSHTYQQSPVARLQCPTKLLWGKIYRYKLLSAENLDLCASSGSPTQMSPLPSQPTGYVPAISRLKTSQTRE